MPKNVGVAIMAKLDMLCRSDDENSYVTFNLPADPWDPDSLAFADPAEGGGAKEIRLQEMFSHAVNLVPTGGRVFASDGRMLWDVYRTVIEQMRLAAPRLTEAEQTELDEAYLSLSNEEGPTPEYEAYLEHEARVLQARGELSSACFTAEAQGRDADSDPEIERLRQAVARAERDWLAIGFKAKVGAALAAISRLSGGDLGEMRDDYEERLRAGERGATAIGSWYETGYLPHGIVDSDVGWAKVTLDRAEINWLVEQADPEIRRAGEAFSVDGGASDVEVKGVTMKVGRVRILRPWCDMNIILNRAWDWQLGPLSDGQGGGLLPAFIKQMLLVRDVQFELRENSAVNARALARLRAGSILTVGPFALKAAPGSGRMLRARSVDLGRMDAAQRKRVMGWLTDKQLSSSAAVLAKRVGTPVAVSRPKARPQVAVTRSHPVRAVRRRVPVAVRARRAVLANNPRVITARAAGSEDMVTVRRTGRRVVRDHRESAVSGGQQVIGETVVRDHRTRARMVGAIRRPGGQRLEIANPRPQIVSIVPTTRAQDGDNDADIQLVGYVCHRLPALPNPDPSLAW
jgi:hypothetical protein